MDSNAVQLIGFADDDALDDIFAGFGLFADYKSFLLGRRLSETVIAC